MMTRVNSTTATIAVAADYADAMMTARRAKNWLFILLLLVLLVQLAIFFMVRFRILRLEGDVSVTVPTSIDVSTQPADGTTQPAVDADVQTTTKRAAVEDILRYLIPLTDFLGMTLVIVLCVVLMLIVMIMLVGRLIGVSHVTSAFIWCVILAVLLFPWQALLIGSKRPPTELPSPYLATEEQHPEFKLPGALYTWPELKRDANFSGGLPGALKWARFVGFPAAAMLLLLMVQAKSSRGLKFALGESEVQVEVTGTSV
jgi:hypothetical protein